MATPPPDNIADDFFDQLFSNSSIPLQLASGEPAAGGSGFPPGPLFPLSLSLDQGNGGLPNSDNASVTAMHDAARAPLGSLFPAFGQVQQHQVRPDHAASQVFHGQMGQGGVGAGQQQQHQVPRPRVRARRGQATDPHSIAERLRRERIAERMRALQELVPNINKTDKAAMLDEVLDYVKFLRLQVKVLSMSRLGGTGAVAQLVADIPLSSLEEEAYEGGSKQQVWEKWSTDGTERQVAKLMDEDVGAAMQFLQSKALCIMPISLATAIYHTHQNSGSPSIKHEPNTPS